MQFYWKGKKRSRHDRMNGGWSNHVLHTTESVLPHNSVVKISFRELTPNVFIYGKLYTSVVNSLQLNEQWLVKSHITLYRVRFTTEFCGQNSILGITS
jgi:hypothetical protein